MTHACRLAFAAALAGSVFLGAAGIAGAQTPAPTDTPKTDAAKPDTTKPDTTKPDAKTVDAAKKPSKAELGEMLKKCSDEADAKGLTIQKGKAEARKAYRRSCMLKNGVAPRKK